MRRTTTRRLLAGFVATAICTVATVVGGVTPAQAAPSGYLLMKGTGSVYSTNYIVNQGAIPGGNARTFSYRIVNSGPTSQQFKVTLSTFTPALTATLYRGSTKLPSPFYTAPIAPGGSLTLTLKGSIAAGASQGEYDAVVQLRDPETNISLDSGIADLHATYQTGNTARDLFLKTGTQPYVGGSYGPQYETANTLKVGNTATFSLRLQNNSATPAAIGLDDIANTSFCPSNFSMVVKQGTTNVTSAVLAGTYSTGILGPGAKRELKVLIKLVSATSCSSAYYGFQASGPSGSVQQYAHVITAA